MRAAPVVPGYQLLACKQRGPGLWHEPGQLFCKVKQMPGYWMYETSGVLRPAVEAYLNNEPMTDAHIGAMRAYLRQWMDDTTWAGNEIVSLRERIDGIVDRPSLQSWLDDAFDAGIDPL